MNDEGSQLIWYPILWPRDGGPPQVLPFPDEARGASAEDINAGGDIVLEVTWQDGSRDWGLLTKGGFEPKTLPGSSAYIHKLTRSSISGAI